MPFANKFKFTLGIPDAGKRLGDFLVESTSVRHAPQGDGRYEYPVELVLDGPGGKQAVSKTIRDRFGGFRTTFSGYGNPYQLRFGRFEVESLGDRRYRVSSRGIGGRFDLAKELRRFVDYAEANGVRADGSLIEPYIEAYRKDVTRRKPSLPY